MSRSRTRRVSTWIAAAGLLVPVSLLGAAMTAHAATPCDTVPANGAMVDGRLAIVGTSADDHLDGGSENDIIFSQGGTDHLWGGGGDDILCGGSGDDTLEAGSGDDQLYGGGGANLFNGGAGQDIYDTTGDSGDRFDSNAP
jgi:Ca2+-binding RTX toxin-like protein